MEIRWADYSHFPYHDEIKEAVIGGSYIECGAVPELGEWGEEEGEGAKSGLQWGGAKSGLGEKKKGGVRGTASPRTREKERG